MSESSDSVSSKIKSELDDKGYKIKSFMCSGAFAKVYKATRSSKKSDDSAGEEVVIKITELDKVSDKLKNKFLPREVQLTSEVKHKHIIAFHNSFKTDTAVYIVMELAENGDLSQYLKKCDDGMSESDACKWFKQIAEAVNYLHNDKKIAHRGLIIDHILLDKNNDVKLSDFKFARKVGDSDADEDNEIVLPEELKCYYSPQMAQKQAYNPMAADVWSLGVILFNMVNMKNPFHSDYLYKEQTDKDFIDGRFIKKVSDELKQLQKGMFTVDESERWTIEKCLNSDWVKRGGRSEGSSDKSE